MVRRTDRPTMTNGFTVLHDHFDFQSLQAILLLVTIYSLIHIVISIRDIGKQYFKKFWNWYEMLTTLMTIVAVGMYMGCVVEATNTFNHLLQDKTGFTNFERVMYVHVGMRYLHAWLLFLLMYKVILLIAVAA